MNGLNIPLLGLILGFSVAIAPAAAQKTAKPASPKVATAKATFAGEVFLVHGGGLRPAIRKSRPPRIFMRPRITTRTTI